jgi:hypothetical protein
VLVLGGVLVLAPSTLQLRVSRRLGEFTGKNRRTMCDKKNRVQYIHCRLIL